MTVDELVNLFEKHEDEFLEYAKVEKWRSKDRDIHVFLLLEEIVPPLQSGIMIAWASHDQIHLRIGVEVFAEVVTEDQVVELIRCGVRLDDDNEGLAMFV